MKVTAVLVMVLGIMAGSAMAAEADAVPAILDAAPTDMQVMTLDDSQLAQIQGTSTLQDLLADLLPAGHPSLQDSLAVFLAAGDEARVEIIRLHVEYILNMFLP